jgi:hypothetical protein
MMSGNKGKPMEAPPEESGQSALMRVDITLDPSELPPDFIKEFGDEDALYDFLESLSEHDCSIMKHNRDNLALLRKLRDEILSDLDETSKELAME